MSGYTSNDIVDFPGMTEDKFSGKKGGEKLKKAIADCQGETESMTSRQDSEDSGFDKLEGDQLDSVSQSGREKQEQVHGELGETLQQEELKQVIDGPNAINIDNTIIGTDTLVDEIRQINDYTVDSDIHIQFTGPEDLISAASSESDMRTSVLQGECGEFNDDYDVEAGIHVDHSRNGGDMPLQPCCHGEETETVVSCSV